MPEPAGHDFTAARSYLSLILRRKVAKTTAAKLARAHTVSFKAKDILRASELPLLPETNPDVKKELARISAGEALSPCLLVRGQLGAGRPAQIADGYHRVCASNYVNEDADIPVRIVSL
ncbi:MAG: hypothetical protein M3N46_07975 [Actinomycetota bacterium]|nr:hypothetical protein [Actinomycetota bacterium]